MHRVELKGVYLAVYGDTREALFLMHRVELKVTNSAFRLLSLVPNAPCGVESEAERTLSVEVAKVPNAPCGVERHLYVLP